MFCEKCGKEIDDKSLICPYCGEKINTNSEPVLENMNSEERRKYVELVKDKHLKTKKTIIIATPVIVILCIVAGILQIFDENHAIKDELPIKDMVPLFIVSIVAAIVGIALYFREKKLLDNEDKIEEQALSLCKSEKTKAQKEEQLNKRIKEGNTPDFCADKEFDGKDSIAWINTKDRLLQCALPCGEYYQGKQKILMFNVPKLIDFKKKTKVYSLNDITDFELIASKNEKVVEDVRVHDSTASSTREKIVHYFYDVEIKLNDLDCPYISVPFGEDEVTAKNFEQVLNILLKK